MIRGCCTCGGELYEGESDDDCPVTVCIDLRVTEQVACGWAFDAGMREAERDAFVVRVAQAAECESDEADEVVGAVTRVVREKYAFSLEAGNRAYEMRARLLYPDEDIEALVFGRDAAVAAAVAAERTRCVEINRVRLLPDFPGEVGPDCSEPECIACWATKAIESGESAESFTARVEALREKWRADDESGAPAPREG